MIRDARATGPATVRLMLGKAGGAIDANKVRMRRGSAGWIDLGNFTSREVFDRTPLLVPGQPEQREYEVQGRAQGCGDRGAGRDRVGAGAGLICIQCSVFSVQCSVFSVQCSVCSMQYAVKRLLRAF